jgi:uncharacterized repeat protein (TIGR03803 family)
MAQAQTETVLHSFGAPPDGGNPEAGVILDSAGNLYGTTLAGGASGGTSSVCPPVFQLDSGCGTVFKVDAAGNETVLYSFAGGTDGKQPWAGVIQDSAGDLYGTTQLGGTHGLGVVFKVDTTGHETVLHSFAGSPDGNYPVGGLIFDSAGNLYGTTGGGGAASSNCPSGCGTVFKLDPTGNETVLYSFKSGTDGSAPYAGVILDSAGNIYGTTLEGGISGCANSLTCGVVFRLDPSGNETVLYTFTGGADGGQPWGGVTQDSEGNLYGTTATGGASGYGVVFRVDTSGHETVLHSFTGGADGSAPYAGVVLDSAGNIYGTTTSGGSSSEGIVFRMDPSGNETVLYTFTGKSDGGTPIAGVVLDSEYNLYGTTYWDGATSVWGVVYKVSGANLTPQTITFGALPNQTYGIAPFTVSATASSGLPVSFNSQTSAVCTVSGSTVTLAAGGKCTIQATQAGKAD